MHKAGTGQANLNYRGNNVFSAISSSAARFKSGQAGRKRRQTVPFATIRELSSKRTRKEEIFPSPARLAIS